MLTRCSCHFVAIGEPMDDAECKVHDRAYTCDDCGCHDYRPRRIVDDPNDNWPTCVCGHMAQAHN